MRRVLLLSSLLWFFALPAVAQEVPLVIREATVVDVTDGHYARIRASSFKTVGLKRWDHPPRCLCRKERT